MVTKTSFIRNLMTTLAFLVIMPVSGQWRYGLRVGGSFASPSLSKTEDVRVENGSGFTGGLMLEYQIPTNGFCVDVSVLYERYSFKLVSADRQRIKSTKNLIDIPVHLKYKFPVKFMSNVINPLIYTGPELSLICGKTGDATHDMKRFVPRWDVGLGIDIVNFIQITGGYSFGLTNNLKQDDADKSPALRFNGWNVGVNILFDF